VKLVTASETGKGLNMETYLGKHLNTRSDLVSFLEEGNSLGDDTCAAMLGPQPV
jgi:hypothetical protein